ncbi:Short-chain alcohol dehydrogenase [Pseudomonas syringae pv. helianthi]|uniref:Short-chain alcohol dehydrogenase n=1 Tax=Pseudomonas syringae pv. helianthi TaxID=251654 RepID=A0A3M6D5E9_9PSED|nr:SDR family oxidoreductase [Pseudomonas syringae group genomosp. 7]RMV51352.1 Short-chain alcohol dehydrogenase [Pseudomonas syringae pv. helianthi]
MKALSEKIALVTGASSGIGEATARKLASVGVKVGIAARRADRLEALKADIERLGGQALVLEMDVADKASVEAGVKKLVDTYGGIDIAVNNAGLMPLSNIDEFKTDEWDKMVDVNIKGVLNLSAAVLPHFIKHRAGHIINTSSVAGRKVLGRGFAVYAATKFAVSAFTEGLRMEVGQKYNIRVTSIQPGATATELFNHTTSEEFLQVMAGFSSQVEFLLPADIADTVLYAVSAPEHVNIAELYVMPTNQV